jgi:hypothetical protein
VNPELPATCTACKGRGNFHPLNDTCTVPAHRCFTCNGTGKAPVCPTCNNTGLVDGRYRWCDGHDNGKWFCKKPCPSEFHKAAEAESNNNPVISASPSEAPDMPPEATLSERTPEETMALVDQSYSEVAMWDLFPKLREVGYIEGRTLLKEFARTESQRAVEAFAEGLKATHIYEGIKLHIPHDDIDAALEDYRNAK